VTVKSKKTKSLKKAGAQMSMKTSLSSLGTITRRTRKKMRLRPQTGMKTTDQSKATKEEEEKEK
jgi:hypothetical protein